MGRTATGVRGMKLAKGEEVRSLVVLEGDGDVLTASERGYGKRTPEADYPRKGRGTQGVIALQTTARNGKLVGAIQLSDQHEVLLISDGGTLVRTRAAEIAQVGRNTQGVTLIRLAADETLQAIERVDASLDEEETAGIAAEAQAPPPPAGCSSAHGQWQSRLSHRRRRVLFVFTGASRALAMAGAMKGRGSRPSRR
jgi:DNA gyrase subunit A